MECHYFDASLCRSCTHLKTPLAQQLERKQHRVQQILSKVIPAAAWLAPFASTEAGFRNKVKLAVGGSIDAPTLGLTDRSGRGVDLRECAIQAPAIWDVIPDLAGFVTYAGLAPYDVAARRGELKYIIVTANSDGELMVRFVVRDEQSLKPLRAALPALLQRLPQITVVSANIHPEHKAVVEGDLEVGLAGEPYFRFPLGDVTLYLRHRSFFQTNTDVARGLYAQAALWANELDPKSVLDLYCGVGGFALHLAAPNRRVHGVEIEPDAVESANRSAAELAAKHAEFGPANFATGDATAVRMPEDEVPDLVVVNPPRRGIESLVDALEVSDVPSIIYSSCNPTSLAEDLAKMPSYSPTSARLFDMFAHTDHAEVVVLLQRHP